MFSGPAKASEKLFQTALGPGHVAAKEQQRASSRGLHLLVLRRTDERSSLVSRDDTRAIQAGEWHEVVLAGTMQPPYSSMGGLVKVTDPEGQEQLYGMTCLHSLSRNSQEERSVGSPIKEQQIADDGEGNPAQVQGGPTATFTSSMLDVGSSCSDDDDSEYLEDDMEITLSIERPTATSDATTNPSGTRRRSDSLSLGFKLGAADTQMWLETAHSSHKDLDYALIELCDRAHGAFVAKDRRLRQVQSISAMTSNGAMSSTQSPITACLSSERLEHAYGSLQLRGSALSIGSAGEMIKTFKFRPQGYCRNTS